MIVRAGACVHGWCMCARRRDCLSTQRERNISHSFANRNYPNCATIPTAQRHCVVSHVSFRFVINYSSPALILPILISSFTSRCPAATHAGQHTLRLVRLTKDVIDDLRRATPQHHQFHRFLTGELTWSKLVTTICIDLVTPLPLKPSSLSAVAMAAASISGVSAPSCSREDGPCVAPRRNRHTITLSQVAAGEENNRNKIKCEKRTQSTATPDTTAYAAKKKQR